MGPREGSEVRKECGGVLRDDLLLVSRTEDLTRRGGRRNVTHVPKDLVWRKGEAFFPRRRSDSTEGPLSVVLRVERTDVKEKGSDDEQGKRRPVL